MTDELRTSKRNHELLRNVRTALGDWATTYAPEFGGAENVKASWQRITDGGGTLAYIGDLISQINDELERTASETSACPQPRMSGNTCDCNQPGCAVCNPP